MYQCRPQRTAHDRMMRSGLWMDYVSLPASKSRHNVVTLRSRHCGMVWDRRGKTDDSEDNAMELRSPNTRQFAYARPIVECAQCGDRIFAPQWSEYLDERRARHLWACDACGYEFETLVVFPPAVRDAAA